MAIYHLFDLLRSADVRRRFAAMRTLAAVLSLLCLLPAAPAFAASITLLVDLDPLGLAPGESAVVSGRIQNDTADVLTEHDLRGDSA
jgi:hypothetical protein